MSEKTSGAKIAPFYNPQADYAEYAREMDARRFDKAALQLNCHGFIIALGYKFQGEPESMAYVADSGGTTMNPQDAKMFDTWADAMRFALDKCEIPALDPVPRGFERPKFPRVCHARIWEEITEC